VVEVDVGEQEVPDVAELVPALRQSGLERAEAARGPAVEEREPVLGLEQIDPDRARVAAVEEVDSC
jgi:hypothetical protein